jgi:hypothetical protein
MFYLGGLWYYVLDGVIYSSDISLENKIIMNDTEGCLYLYLYDGAIYCLHNDTELECSEIRRMNPDGSDDFQVIQYNTGTNTKDTINEFTVFSGYLRYTVHSETSGDYTVKYFDIPSLIGGLSDNCCYNKFITLEYMDTRDILVDGTAITGDTMLKDGSYTLTVYDPAGNFITVEMTVDTIAPIITGVENGKEYPVGLVITYDEGICLLDGEPFESGSSVYRAGEHSLYIVDKSGNATEIIFTVISTGGLIGFINSENFMKYFILTLVLLTVFNVLIYIIASNIIKNKTAHKISALYREQIYSRVKNIDESQNKICSELDDKKRNLNDLIEKLK